MYRFVTTSLILCVFAGCADRPGAQSDGQPSSGPPSQTTSTSPKTPEDVRAYLQEQIDRYLGGQQSKEQLNRITMDFQVHTEVGMGKAVKDITISKVLQAFSDKGDKIPNQFRANIEFAGDGWRQTVQGLILYNEKEGTWKSL